MQDIDLTRVDQAVNAAGGMSSNKPPQLDNIKPRDGQSVDVGNVLKNLGEFEV